MTPDAIALSEDYKRSPVNVGHVITFEEPQMGYVYGLFSTSNPGLIRYVGKTKYHPEERLKGHIRTPQGTMGQWIQRNISEGFQIGMAILAKVPLSELDAVERLTIASHPAENLFNVCLFNRLRCTNTSPSAL
jgi:hypothetical protein